MTKEDWVRIFGGAQYGHILWDGRQPDPTNPVHAYDSAYRFYNHARHLGFFQDGSRILDLGCGNGRLAIPFADRKISYLGLDPVKESIDFCHKAFRPFSHLKFEFVDLQNETFNPCGLIDPKTWRLPVEDNSIDDLICYSICTHLQHLEVASHYMDEIRRVVKKGGRLFITWYRSPPAPGPDPFVGRTVFNEWDIMNIMYNFTYLFTYGGHEKGEYYDQWGMFCLKV